MADCRTATVGSGIGPDLLTLPAATGRRSRARTAWKRTVPTAGGEFHPALKTFIGPANRRADSTTRREGSPKCENVVKMRAAIRT